MAPAVQPPACGHGERECSPPPFCPQFDKPLQTAGRASLHPGLAQHQLCVRYSYSHLLSSPRRATDHGARAVTYFNFSRGSPVALPSALSVKCERRQSQTKSAVCYVCCEHLRGVSASSC
uniref:Uncharacterized protein n=1 Tax=Knipowitschia caucasica TaxID=637954 RepID=A0AAV2K4J7_KNICA